MGLISDVTEAAAQARQQRHRLLAEWRAVWMRLTGRVTHLSTHGNPATVILRPDGRARLETRGPSAMVILGRSLLVMAGAALLAGLTWVAVLCLAGYLLLRKLMGMVPPEPAPAAV